MKPLEYDRDLAGSQARCSGLGKQSMNPARMCVLTWRRDALYCPGADWDWRLDRVYFLAFLNP
jgi:hypothetical protein